MSAMGKDPGILPEIINLLLLISAFLGPVNMCTEMGEKCNGLPFVYPNVYPILGGGYIKPKAIYQVVYCDDNDN